MIEILIVLILSPFLLYLCSFKHKMLVNLLVFLTYALDTPLLVLDLTKKEFIAWFLCAFQFFLIKYVHNSDVGIHIKIKTCLIVIESLYDWVTFTNFSQNLKIFLVLSLNKIKAI